MNWVVTMLDRIADFFSAEGLEFVRDERSVSTGFEDVAITVFATAESLLVSARFRDSWRNLVAVNEWNAHHVSPTAFVVDGDLYFKQGLALAEDLDDNQLGFFLSATLGAIGSACEWFAQWK